MYNQQQLKKRKKARMKTNLFNTTKHSRKDVIIKTGRERGW